MEWVLAALAVVVIALAAVAATGWGGGMPDLVDDRVAPDLPPGELTADELRDVQFAVVPDPGMVAPWVQLPPGRRFVLR